MTAGPSRTTPYALLAAAALLALAALRADASGRLLALPAAVVLLVLAARDLVLRPVLLADAHGLEVVSGLRRHQVAWAQVERLRVVTDRRTPLLEVDLGDVLVVLSRSRLGRPPDVVLEELSALQH